MSKNISVDQPAGAITTKDHHSFISVHYGNGFVKSIEAPAPTLTTKDRCALISSKFIDQQFGASKPTSTDKPLGTLTTIPKYRLVSPSFLANQYSGGGQVASLDEPSPAITTTPKQNIVNCELDSDFYLMNPQYSSPGGSVDKPCFTLIARMDKMPPYLIEASRDDELPAFIHFTGQGIVYEIYDTDSEIMKQIKEFMAMYGILNIKMRMLKIPELKKIMGFPENYVLVGTQAEQKKYIGNAVEVNMARVLCEALYKKLLITPHLVA